MNSDVRKRSVTRKPRVRPSPSPCRLESQDLKTCSARLSEVFRQNVSLNRLTNWRKVESPALILSPYHPW